MKDPVYYCGEGIRAELLSEILEAESSIQVERAFRECIVEGILFCEKHWSVQDKLRETQKTWNKEKILTELLNRKIAMLFYTLKDTES